MLHAGREKVKRRNETRMCESSTSLIEPRVVCFENKSQQEDDFVTNVNYENFIRAVLVHCKLSAMFNIIISFIANIPYISRTFPIWNMTRYLPLDISSIGW